VCERGWTDPFSDSQSSSASAIREGEGEGTRGHQQEEAAAILGDRSIEQVKIGCIKSSNHSTRYVELNTARWRKSLQTQHQGNVSTSAV
jgi:hypothetical protein